MRGTVDEHSEVGVVFRYSHQVFGGEAVAEEFGEDFGVSRTNGHAECGTAVSEDTGEHRWIELFEHLCGENVRTSAQVL